MKQVLMNPVFYGSVVLAVINRTFEELGVIIPFVRSYLDDLLCFPIVLSLGLIGYRLIDSNYQLTKWHIWPIVALYAIYFEAYLPSTSALYTADIVDVLMYSVGAVIFDRTSNQSEGKGQVELLA